MINPNLLSVPVIADIINNDEGYMDESGYIVPHVTPEYKSKHAADVPFMLFMFWCIIVSLLLADSFCTIAVITFIIP